MAKTPKKTTGTEPPLEGTETGWSLFVKLFLVPAGIVGIALGIFFLGAMALQNPKTAEESLKELRSDSTKKRWQAAFEISRSLREGSQAQFGPEMRADLVDAYREAGKDDQKVREYLALVLGTLKEKSAIPVLAATVGPENPKDVRVNSLWALGNIEDPAAGPAILSVLSDPDEGVQLMAVGALSALRYKPALEALKAKLESPNYDIQLNSAVALARSGNNSGVPILLRELNSQATQGGRTQQLLQAGKIAAIEASKDLSDVRLLSKIREISKNEPDLKVRNVALQTLKK